MSGFDPDWLDLREPADVSARSETVLAAVSTVFADRDVVAIADLGCGSGAMLRALAPRLGPRQHWTLIDHDQTLLAHARQRLAVWADATRLLGDGLWLAKDDTAIEVAFHAADLSRDPLPPPAARADLVTANALFDLVGERWLGEFAARLAAAGRPIYAALSYNGNQSFSPPDPLDDAVVEAFNRHQRTDKGFGPALGPGAATALARALAGAGYACLERDSFWRLGEDDARLARAVIEGTAQAAAEAPVPEPRAVAWAARRLALPVEIKIDHRDLFASPAAAARAKE